MGSNQEDDRLMAWGSSIAWMMPMVGRGTRMVAGFGSTPKPMILDSTNQPLFMSSFRSSIYPHSQVHDQLVLGCRMEHLYWDDGGMQGAAAFMSNAFDIDTVILPFVGETEGAADSVYQMALAIRDQDLPEMPMVVVNCDQRVMWNNYKLRSMNLNPSDAFLVAFRVHDASPKWSYVELESEPEQALHPLHLATRVAEKQPISEFGTAGIYGWPTIDSYLRSYEAMVQADDRTNGEFYVCPVMNYTMAMGHKCRVIFCEDFVPMGTSEEVIQDV